MLQEELHEDFLQGPVDVLLQPVAQAQVRLRAGKQILHQVTEPRTPLHELHHHVRNTAEQISAQVHAPGERRGVLRIAARDSPGIARIPVSSGLAHNIVRVIQDHLARQIAGTDRVIQTFACDGIHQTARIAHRQPAAARHAIPAPTPASCERRQHLLAVERRILARNTLLGHVRFQPRAAMAWRRHHPARRYPPGKMSAAREHPDVAFKLRQKLNIDTLAGARNFEIAPAR